MQNINNPQGSILRVYDWASLRDLRTTKYLDQIGSDFSQMVAVLELMAAALRRELNSFVFTTHSAEELDDYYARFVQVRRLMLVSQALQSAQHTFRFDIEESLNLSPLYMKWLDARQIGFGPDPRLPDLPVDNLPAELPSAPASPAPSKVKCPGAPRKQPLKTTAPDGPPIPFKLHNKAPRTKRTPSLKMPGRPARKTAPPSRFLQTKTFA